MTSADGVEGQGTQGSKAPPSSPSASGEDGSARRPSPWRIVLGVLAVVAGVGLMSYPFVADVLNQRAQDQVTQTLDRAVSAAAPHALDKEQSAAVDYNRRLLEGSSHVVDPFDPADVKPGNEEYQRILNVAGDGVMAELLIPKIGVDLPIRHYTNEESLAQGVGHVVNTSVPVGGVSTHTVLAAHTGLPTARLFDRLPEVAVGDTFVIRVLGRANAYRVTSTEVVLPEVVESLSVQPGRDMVTLVTCTPYGVNTHRLLVHALRTDLPADWQADGARTIRSVTPVGEQSSLVWKAAIAGVVAAGAVLLALVAVRRVRRSVPPVSRSASKTGVSGRNRRRM
ncbi:class C sortase [Schaalia sp. 19OD2882]|uniref:class C sortase n=1 Tax=Schaalia sp. 19OD2882 TaxID=2794089 RepID=UPI0020A70B0D|nr:class C sortase [Schaalia sp. 19OD2882]